MTDPMDEEGDIMAALAAEIVAERDAEMMAVVHDHFIQLGLPDDPALHRAYLSWRFPD